MKFIRLLFIKLLLFSSAIQPAYSRQSICSWDEFVSGSGPSSISTENNGWRLDLVKLKRSKPKLGVWTPEIEVFLTLTKSGFPQSGQRNKCTYRRDYDFDRSSKYYLKRSYRFDRRGRNGEAFLMWCGENEKYLEQRNIFNEDIDYSNQKFETLKR